MAGKAVGFAALTAGAAAMAYAHTVTALPQDRGAAAADARTHERQLTLDVKHVAFLEARGSSCGAALASVIDAAQARAAQSDEGAADVFNTPRCAGKKLKVQETVAMHAGHWKALEEACSKHGIADPSKAARIVVEWAKEQSSS